jgi:putative endonuclease
MNHLNLGNFGEDYACRYLQKKNYIIRDRKYRYRKNEVDIIAEKNNQLIVIEVKTRQTAEIGEPWQAVTKRKQKEIIKVANQYVQSKELNIDVQFDIISIVHNSYRTQLEHIENAFYPTW